MVEEYADTDDEEELQALESFWVQNFDVVSPTVKGPFEEEILTEGAEIHELSCAACHSSTGSAFTGYAVAKIIKARCSGTGSCRCTCHPLVHPYPGLLFSAWPICRSARCFTSLPVPSVCWPMRSWTRKNPIRPISPPARSWSWMPAPIAAPAAGAARLRWPFDQIGNINILPSEKMIFLKAYVAR